jgi:uncharacterized protein (TIGR02996 family)
MNFRAYYEAEDLNKNPDAKAFGQTLKQNAQYFQNQEDPLDYDKRNKRNDDTVLIFADWLEERGDPRGAALRLLVAMKQEPTKANQHLAKLIRLQRMRRGMDLISGLEEIPGLASWLYRNDSLLKQLRGRRITPEILQDILP